MHGWCKADPQYPVEQPCAVYFRVRDVPWSWTWQRGQIDKSHNPDIPHCRILFILGKPELRNRRISIVCTFFQDTRLTSPAGEALLSSILFERFERSGASFTSILQNVSGWPLRSTPTICDSTSPSWPDQAAPAPLPLGPRSTCTRTSLGGCGSCLGW